MIQYNTIVLGAAPVLAVLDGVSVFDGTPVSKIRSAKAMIEIDGREQL